MEIKVCENSVSTPVVPVLLFSLKATQSPMYVSAFWNCHDFLMKWLTQLFKQMSRCWLEQVYD